MRRTVFVSLVMAAVVVAGCSSAAADDPNNTSVKVSDNGSYATYVDTHKIGERTVTCIIARNNSTMSLSCDWPAR